MCGYGQPHAVEHADEMLLMLAESGTMDMVMTAGSSTLTSTIFARLKASSLKALPARFSLRQHWRA